MRLLNHLNRFKAKAESEALDNILLYILRSNKIYNRAMLSGKGNAVERGKTAIGLISKKATLHVQHTFFCTFICLCFVRLQRETSGNFLVTRFMEEMSYVFSFTFFHCRSFSPCICGRLHFLFCHRCYKIFLLFFQQKNASFVFFSPP